MNLTNLCHHVVQKRIDMNLKEFFSVGEFFTYFFRKKDPNRKPDFNLRVMHTINKIAILMFLVCLGVILYRLFLR